MKQIMAISVALAVSMAATISSSAQEVPPPVVRTSGASATGPWVVGAMGLGVASVMVRASAVGNREQRELTAKEAVEAVFLPFLWVFLPGDPIIVARTTTVKSSKSNTSDRMGGGGGKAGAAARTTTVKSSKSNTSDRMGGGGGKAGAAAKTTTVKSSKSNSSDRVKPAAPPRF
jgi:hypothetical protein